MSTALRERPVAVDAVAARWPAMTALARVEAVRLLRHPATVAALVLLAGLWSYAWAAGDDRYPVLYDADRAVQYAVAALVGGAALVASNLAVLRAHRHRTTDLYEVLVLPPAWRTGAHLLAVLPLAALAGVLVTARLGLLATSDNAVGRPNWTEVVTSPVAVLLAGVLGVLLARLVRSVLVALLAVLVLAIAPLLAATPALPGRSRVPWLLPVPVVNEWMTVPAELLARPAGAHLAYLVGIASLLAVVALARTGARGPRLLTAGGLAFAVTLAGGVVQLLPLDPAVAAAGVRATDRPAEVQVCTRREQVTYCHFAGFEPWVDEWDTVARGVLRRVPATVASRQLAVRQRVLADGGQVDVNLFGGPTGQSISGEEMQAEADARRRADEAAGTPNAVPVSTAWGDGRSPATFAGLFAYEVVTGAGASTGPVCGAPAVLAGWLAGQADPDVRKALRALDDSSAGGVPFSSSPESLVGISIGDREMAVVWQLLNLPADEVARTIAGAWDELSAAGTPTDRIGELLGVRVAPLPPVEERSTCEL